jgi:predicted Na+-dependent transporter
MFLLVCAGNILGVFVTPLLMFQALGCDRISLPYGAVLGKLGWKVLLPVALGQVLRAKVPKLRDFRASHKKAFGKASEISLLAIIYATFCEAFAKVNNSNQLSASL